jgi:hypothetical protein
MEKWSVPGLKFGSWSITSAPGRAWGRPGVRAWRLDSWFPAALARLGNHGVDSANLPDNPSLRAACQERFAGHPGR